MKKIFIILVIFFSMLLSVKAEVYYSTYTDYSDWSNNRIEKSELVDVEVDKKYAYYHENRIGDYYIEGESPDEYNLVDKDMWKKEDSEWLDCSYVKPNQEVEKRMVYYYKYVRPVRYIELSNIHGSNNKLNIAEIKIVARDNNLDYRVICNACSSDFDKYLKNGIISEANSYVVNNNSLILDLNVYLNIDEISLYIYLHDSGEEDVNIDISYKYELDGPNYYRVSYQNRLKTSITNPMELTYKYYNLVLDNPSWTRELVSLDKIEGNNFMSVREVYECKKTDIYYFYYKIFKEYSQVNNDYYDHKDENIYEEYYRYRTRDKVEIKDEIIIDDDQDLKSFIMSSSVDVEIESNIDYSKNGKYVVSYITPFMVIEKDVIVNNRYNDIKEKVDNYISEINNYKLKIDELNKEIESNKKSNNIDNYNEYIEKINNYNIEIEKLNGELTNYKLELENKDKENYKIKREYENEIINLRMSDNDKIEVKEEIKKVNFIPFIILWLLVIIILIIIVLNYRKERRKTSFVENV